VTVAVRSRSKRRNASPTPSTQTCRRNDGRDRTIAVARLDQILAALADAAPAIFSTYGAFMKAGFTDSEAMMIVVGVVTGKMRD